MSPIDYLLAAVLVIVGAVTAFELGVRVRHFLTALRAEYWLQTRGRIVDSKMMTRAHGWLYEPKVTYEYEVGGVRHVGSGISAASELPVFPNAQERIQRYAKGRSVAVFYDPKHPDRAVLERTGAMTINAYMIVLIALLLAAMHGLALVIK